MTLTLQTKDYKRFKVVSSEDFVEPIEFTDATLANGCYNGDKVKWSEENGCTLVKRADHPVLAGILELTSKTKYGMTSRGIPMYLFVPYRQEYPALVVGCSEKILTHNKLVLVKADDAVPIGRSLPRGNLVDTLGLSGDPKVERLALLWTYTPYKMPNALVKAEPNKEEVRKEFELRPHTPPQTFHIDPPDCRDVDDVLSIERIDPLTQRIWITISDVAEWVKPGSEVDEYAKKTTATTYENGQPVRPMLPIGYSEGACSLLPGHTCLGISLTMDWDGSSLSNLMFIKSVVKTAQTYTYEQVDANNTGTFDTFKRIVSFLTGIESPNSHEIIEAFMILYNREVAMVLRKLGIGILRRHDTNKINQWEKFEGINTEIAKLAYKAAEYVQADAQDVYHAGLKTDVYCTATSPIRRYADLENQRILKALLGFTKQPELEAPKVDISWLNRRQKDLKRYERDIFHISNMLHNEKRIVQGILLDWSSLENNRMKFHLYIPEWKKIMKWNTNGRAIDDNRALCVLQLKGQIIETVVEKTMCLRFEVFWNTQTRFWKDRLVLRLA